MPGLRIIRPKVERCQFGSFGFFLMQGTLGVYQKVHIVMHGPRLYRNWEESHCSQLRLKHV